MLPLILLGVAAVALAGCSRSDSDHSSSSGTRPPEPHTPPSSPPAATAAGPYRFQRSLQLTNPRGEYQDLCEVLFNTRELSQCDTMLASRAATLPPSTDAGLAAYYRGISRRDSGYSFEFADRDARWSALMHRLQGSSLYLAGHGGCPADNPRAPTCLKINGGREIPERFDFMDDYYNLMGAFFFLQANREAVFSGASCTLVAATLGSEDRPFCHAFAMHNLLLTPVSQRLRNVDVTMHFSPLRDLALSRCEGPPNAAPTSSGLVP